MSATLVARTFFDCLTESIDSQTNEFKWDVFFRLWFRERGTPSFFLFKRHLGVTNTQYVELFSLLQAHCIHTGRRPTDLLLHTTEQVKNTLVEAVTSVLDAPATQRSKHLAAFSERYCEIFANTVAIDMFYCSCAVFVPPGLQLDLPAICGDAGYVHSAGYSVFVRNIKKARQSDFEASLDTYLERRPQADLPVPFVVYAHEDFSGHDREAREQISRGIENTKLHLEKMSMGSYRLAQVVHEMRRKYLGRLTIPEPGSYKSHSFDTDRTFWLIADRSVTPGNTMSAGADRYYICYEQVIKSANPTFFFDENKPAWKSHTTLPHSLTSALINITRPHGAHTRLCDPFGGTGTTWLEAKRLTPTTQLLCSDLSPAAQLLAQDNLDFFLMGSDLLRGLMHQLQEILDAVKDDSKASAGEGQNAFLFDEPSDMGAGVGPYLKAVSLLNTLRHDQPEEDQEFWLSPEFVEQLSRANLITRFAFYVVLRAEMRYQGGYKRKSVTFEKAFCSSMEELIAELQQLLAVREAVERKPYTVDGRNLYVKGSYSVSAVPAFLVENREQLARALRSEISVKDARKLSPNSIDVIICDPPYGFNTKEDQDQLALLYSEFLDSAIAAIRNGGHLIICLPAESYTGRELPYCTRHNLITNQVLAKSKAMGKYMYMPARSVPSRAFNAPYYWEAERALRRVILHFRVANGVT
jgi:hypothetical protein